jgi:hypothetical protein
MVPVFSLFHVLYFLPCTVKRRQMDYSARTGSERLRTASRGLRIDF